MKHFVFPLILFLGLTLNASAQTKVTATDVAAGSALQTALDAKADTDGGNTFTGRQVFGDSIGVTPVERTVVEGSPDTVTLLTSELLNTATLDEDTNVIMDLDGISTGQVFGARLTNSSSVGITASLKQSNGSTALTVYSSSYGANKTSFPIPANGVVDVLFEKTAGGYHDLGSFPRYKTKYIGTVAAPDTTGGTVTISDAIDGVMVNANTATAYNLEDCSNWPGGVLTVFNCGTNTITVNPDNTDIIILPNGTALSAGDAITIQNTFGSRIVAESDGTRIRIWASQGTITDVN